MGQILGLPCIFSQNRLQSKSPHVSFAAQPNAGKATDFPGATISTNFLVFSLLANPGASGAAVVDTFPMPDFFAQAKIGKPCRVRQNKKQDIAAGPSDLVEKFTWLGSFRFCPIRNNNKFFTNMNRQFLKFATLLLLLAPLSAIAQKSSKKSKGGLPETPVVTVEMRVALLDSLAETIETSLDSLAQHRADRTDGGNQEIVYAYSNSPTQMDTLFLLKNELLNENGQTQNHFYLHDGGVFCWTLLRVESKYQNPRPRRRLVKYYLEKGVIFYASEQVAAADEDVAEQPVSVVSLSDVQATTVFLNKKFQYTLDAFRQGWKVTGN